MLNKGTVKHRYAILDIYDCMLEYEREERDVINKTIYDKLVQGLKDIHKIIGDEYDTEKSFEGEVLYFE